MYSGELEVQAKRKAIAVLQDEINRILNAARSLSALPELIVKKDKNGIKETLEQIASLEEEVETLRRKPVKFGEGCKMLIPSQAQKWEGVES